MRTIPKTGSPSNRIRLVTEKPPPEHQNTREPDSQTANHNDSQDLQTTRLPGQPQTATENHSVYKGNTTTLVYSREEEDERKVEEKWSALFESEQWQDIPKLAFVRLAYERSCKNTWEKNRKSSTWEFIRYLKARVEFDNLEPYEALSDLSFMIDLSEEEQLTITKEWPTVEAPAGMGPLEWALKMAREYPLKDPPGPRLPLYVTFVSLAGHLQSRREKPILLPVEKLAPLLRTSPRTISTLRKLAQDYGLLKEVAPYLIKRRATEFLFDVDRFPMLRERQ